MDGSTEGVVCGDKAAHPFPARPHRQSILSSSLFIFYFFQGNHVEFTIHHCPSKIKRSKRPRHRHLVEFEHLIHSKFQKKQTIFSSLIISLTNHRNLRKIIPPKLSRGFLASGGMDAWMQKSLLGWDGRSCSRSSSSSLSLPCMSFFPPSDSNSETFPSLPPLPPHGIRHHTSCRVLHCPSQTFPFSNQPLCPGAQSFQVHNSQLPMPA